MSASTKNNSDKHIYRAQATGVHQEFTYGYQRGSIKNNGPNRGREEFNTHNVKGWSTQTLVLLRKFCRGAMSEGGQPLVGPMKNDVLLFSGNLGCFPPFERGTTLR